MASVNFLIRSTTNQNEVFTARYQFSNPEKQSEKNPQGFEFIEAKTEISVFTLEELKDNPLLKGKDFWKRNKNYKGRDIEIAERVIRINSEHNELRKFILSEIEKTDKPSKEYLQAIIKKFYDKKKGNEDKEANSKKPTDVLWHFDNYIKLKSKSLKPRTLLKLQNQKNIFKGFQDFYSGVKGYPVTLELSDIDTDFQFEFEAYLRDVKKYSHNTIAKSVKVLKTIVLASRKYDLPLSPALHEVGMAYEEHSPVFLSFEELNIIKGTDVPERLKNAKEWLYLSCFLGQRFGDFMRFNKSMVKEDNHGYFIDFIQEKTGKKIHLLLHPAIVEYLKNNDFNFPSPIIEQTYNQLIKEVCELAGIDEMTEGRLMDNISDDEDEAIYRKVSGIYPKYKLIGSHIGRKSYCTNFYGLMPTPLIMEVSGHSEEQTLRAYIGKKDKTMAELTMNYYNNIKIK